MIENLRPNEQRAKTAIIVFGILLLIQTVSLISGVLQYNLLNELALGHFVSQSDIASNDLREQVLTITLVVALVVSLIVFILWFRRAYYNLHLKAAELTYSEGWAAGGWFVPVMNFAIPYKI